ncbi:hypothetical protein GCK72_006574 [Caenorhabditis remanei]|uniref:Uncharacterized protein n=1 Tax=Caenorhabditis remanei TaxID=31234 RepID=A0A6A5HIU5_CAERE|nr:hypothetical protein GCK72_006574 [Caenorhabditis remanei]KAF1766616.1 hypothetical protein GCK72_006574 [Caenorhabditis remanei]
MQIIKVRQGCLMEWISWIGMGQEIASNCKSTKKQQAGLLSSEVAAQCAQFPQSFLSSLVILHLVSFLETPLAAIHLAVSLVPSSELSSSVVLQEVFVVETSHEDWTADVAAYSYELAFVFQQELVTPSSLTMLSLLTQLMLSVCCYVEELVYLLRCTDYLHEPLTFFIIELKEHPFCLLRLSAILDNILIISKIWMIFKTSEQ